jgi:hypothetical protein
VSDDPEFPIQSGGKMRIRVLGSAFYNESLLIILGIVLGIAAGGTAVATVLDNGPVEPQLSDGMIQAQATIQAAWIQGLMTLLAGLAAIAAAIIGISLSKGQHNARVAAYRIKLMLVIENLRSQAALKYGISKDIVKKHGGVLDGYYLDLPHLTEPIEFNENEWEHHALLGEKVVREIYQCRLKLRNLNNLLEEVSEKKLPLDGISAISPIPRKFIDHNEKPYIRLLLVSEENYVRAAEVLESLDILLSLINPEHKVLADYPTDLDTH